MLQLQKYLLVLICLVPWSISSAASTLLPHDDSYTVAERFERYRKTHPEIVWPTMVFKQNQQFMNDISYHKIGERELHLDVFLPSVSLPKQSLSVNIVTLRPAILLVHGGGWRSGNKSHFYPMANKLAQLGYVVVLPEYRLSAEAQYPAGLIDINHAIVWVKQHAAELHIDINRLAIGGGSSGGQMASLLATTAHSDLFKQGISDKDTSVQAIVNLDGVLDFTSSLGLAHENKKGEQSAAALWLGGTFEQIPERWREASAANYINAKTPAMLVISSGQSRFTAGKEDVFTQLQQLGIPHEYFEFKQAFHTFWLFDPFLTQTVDRIEHFLRQHMPPDN